MVASDDEAVFTYDSDEGYDGPSDEDLSDGGYFEEESPAIAAVELPDKSSRTEDPLATYRQLWFQDTGFRTATGVDEYIAQCELMLAGPARDAFSTVELLQLVLDLLPTNDLRSMTQVSSYFRVHAQSRLFRRLSLGSFVRVNQLLGTPRVFEHLRELTLSGWDSLESALSNDVVKEQLAALEAGDPDVAVEWFWRKGQSVGRQVWPDEVERERQTLSAKRGGQRTPEEEMARTRRRAQLAAILRTVDPSTKEDVNANLRSELEHWPYGSALPTSPSAPSPDSFTSLLSNLTSLTLTFPLAHVFTSLCDALSGASHLDKLAILAQSSRRINPLNRQDFRAAAPVAMVLLGQDGYGPLGAPPFLTQLEISHARLLQPSPIPLNPPINASPPTTPSLKRLVLLHVSAAPDAQSRRSTEQHVRLLEEEEVPEDDEDEGNYPLTFDLSRFVGSPSRLTHLTLHNVRGVVPSTIFLAIRESGPQLQLLDLADLNGAAPDRRPHPEDPPPVVSRHDFFSSAAFQNEDTFRRIAASGTSVSRPRPLNLNAFRTWPALTFAEALTTCTSLRILRLVSRNAASPYMPPIVDALLAARPPLRVLNWSVGVPGPKWADGWMDWKGWERFARTVREVGEWSTLRGKVEMRADEWEWMERDAEEGTLANEKEEPSTVHILY